MLDSRDKKTIALLCAVGLIVRLVYFLEYRSLLEFLHPTVDALYHHITAKAIADGALISSEPFFRAPLYNYFLGLIYFFTNDSLAAARLIQLLIGTFTAPLVYLLGREVFDRRTGLLAAVFVLLTSDIVYFEGELVLEATAMWLIMLSLLLLAGYAKNPRSSTLCLLALSSGLAVVDRPNAALLIPIVGLVLWSIRRQEPSSVLLKRVVLFAVVSMVPVGLVLVHNVTRTQPALTIATQGGVNFYIGNNSSADGMSAVMPGKLGYNWQYSDIKYAAEEKANRSLSPSEVSSFYLGEGIHFIKSHPFEWLGLTIKKAYLIFSGEDISNNRNLLSFKSEFAILKLLVIGMGLLAPLGLIGMVLTWRRSLATRALGWFVVLYAASFVLYFVNSRFRLPLLPVLAIFAAYFIISAVEQIRRRELTTLIVPVLGAIVLAVMLNVNLYRIQFNNEQQAYFSKGNLYLENGDQKAAIEKYYQALSYPTLLQQVHLNLGIAFLKSGQLDSAWHHFLAEDSLFSGSAEALNNLAYLYRQTGQKSEALIAAEAAMTEKPYLPEARLNYWYALREAGLADSAYASIKQIESAESLGRSEKFILAVAAIDLGRFEEADTLLRTILDDLKQKRMPSYSEASNSASGTGRLAPVLFESRVYYNLGLAKANLGLIDTAIVYLRQSVENDPGLAEGWTNLGSAYFAQKDYSSAIAAFEQARRLTPESEIVLFNLAISYSALGNLTAARSVAEECARLHPEFGPAQQLIKTIDESER